MEMRNEYRMLELLDILRQRKHWEIIKYRIETETETGINATIGVCTNV